MTENSVVVTKSERVATVTINRESVLNALNGEAMQALADAFEELSANPDLRVVLLTGRGQKAFVAGADISFMQNMSPTEACDWGAFGQRVFSMIEKMPKIVIAAVNGYALGGGCELALACDIRIAGDNAVFGQPEIKLGHIPGFGGTQRLPRLVGKGRAKIAILTGDFVSAQEALEMGLVERVVPQQELMEAAMELATKIAGHSPYSLKYAKQLINASDEAPIEVGCAMEAQCLGLCFSTEEQRKGMSDFLNRSKSGS